jgi:hypothetical protein
MVCPTDLFNNKEAFTTIRISSDFSSLIVVDDDQKSEVVTLDPARDTNPADAAVVDPRPLAAGHPDWLYPAFLADPGFQLFTQSSSSYVVSHEVAGKWPLFTKLLPR